MPRDSRAHVIESHPPTEVAGVMVFLASDAVGFASPPADPTTGPLVLILSVRLDGVSQPTGYGNEDDCPCLGVGAMESDSSSPVAVGPSDLCAARRASYTAIRCDRFPHSRDFLRGFVITADAADKPRPSPTSLAPVRAPDEPTKWFLFARPSRIMRRSVERAYEAHV
jgi:hypothetical protein